MDTTTKDGDGVKFGETCEYHSRGKEYMLLFWRDLWVPQQSGEVLCLSRGGLCQLLTDNLLRVIIYSETSPMQTPYALVPSKVSQELWVPVYFW